MEWSPQQHEALEKVRRWLDAREPQVFRLFGYAGTGKTTLAIEIARMVRGHVCFAAFTGKAALVMNKKGCMGARTIHSLIYRRRLTSREDEPEWVLNHDSELAGASLCIIDECSMVDERLGTDLLSFHVPVLVLGDPAQLPPVRGTGFFTEGHEPDIMLTEVHRQAAGNPIIHLATEMREGRAPQPGAYKGDFADVRVMVMPWDKVRDRTETLLNAGQIICGRNDTRLTLNRHMRNLLRQRGTLPAGDHLPVVGDRVICLKNKRDRGLLNGGMFTVQHLTDRAPEASKPGSKDCIYAILDSLDDAYLRDVAVRVPRIFWDWNGKQKIQVPEGIAKNWDEFAYAYAVTCHKSQGSQWDNVLIKDESDAFDREGEMMGWRWRYTATTRASERLVVGI